MNQPTDKAPADSDPTARLLRELRGLCARYQDAGLGFVLVCLSDPQAPGFLFLGTTVKPAPTRRWLQMLLDTGAAQAQGATHEPG